MLVFVKYEILTDSLMERYHGLCKLSDVHVTDKDMRWI